MKYERTQIGWYLIVILLLSLIGISLGYIYQWGNNPLSKNIYQLFFFILILITINFYKLKIRIDENGINLSYGIGLISCNINPDKIEEIKVIKTPLLAGLGIRLLPKGTLYNIQGRSAVKVIYLKDNVQKQVSIGSDNPFELKAFLEQRFNLRSHQK